MTSGLVEYLPWDSAHFGLRVARATLRSLDDSAYLELLESCRDQDIECLYFLADAADQTTVAILQAGGFDFVDIRHTLEKNTAGISTNTLSGNILIRRANKRDLETLLPIAAQGYRESRFFNDPRFGHDKASQMYQIWLRKSLTTDFAHIVIVAEISGQAVGFVTCHLREPAAEANIGLVGVAETARGKGCASGMINHALHCLSSRGIDRISVVTQGSNIAAQRLYQRCGFVTRSVELWFHKWFQQSD